MFTTSLLLAADDSNWLIEHKSKSWRSVRFGPRLLNADFDYHLVAVNEIKDLIRVHKPYHVWLDVSQPLCEVSNADALFVRTATYHVLDLDTADGAAKTDYVGFDHGSNGFYD